MTLAELKTLDAGYKFSNGGGKTYPYRGQGVTIPSFEEFTNSIDEDDFFEFCGFYVDNYLLNELYRDK